MSLSDADVVCFDADFTLVKYKNQEFSKLQFFSMAKSMISLGAPAELLTVIDLNMINQLGCCGIIADFQTGCMLKLSKSNRILKAYHGIHPFTDLDQFYGPDHIYPLTQQEKYYLEDERIIFLTHFAIGGILTWLGSVQLMKDKIYQLESFTQLSRIFREAIRKNFLDKELSQSPFYTEVFRAPEIYIQKVTQEFKDNLVWLKENGKKLVVVTNSHHEYANFIFEFSFGSDWHSYFDAYVFSAGKPEFFFSDSEMETIEHLELDGDAYNKGSSRHLKDTIGGHVYAFIGDHYLGDVHGPKHKEWKTVALVEEIYFEKSIKGVASAEEIENAGYLKPDDDDVLDYYQAWGSHFVDGGERTYWWEFLLQHADVVIPNIEAIFDCFK